MIEVSSFASSFKLKKKRQILSLSLKKDKFNIKMNFNFPANQKCILKLIKFNKVLPQSKNTDLAYIYSS